MFSSRLVSKDTGLCVDDGCPGLLSRAPKADDALSQCWRSGETKGTGLATDLAITLLAIWPTARAQTNGIECEANRLP
jgi:hypothetical protein